MAACRSCRGRNGGVFRSALRCQILPSSLRACLDQVFSPALDPVLAGQGFFQPFQVAAQGVNLLPVGFPFGLEGRDRGGDPALEFVALPPQSQLIGGGGSELVLKLAVRVEELGVLVLEDDRVAGFPGRFQFLLQPVDSSVQEPDLFIVAGLVDGEHHAEGGDDAAEDGEEEAVLAEEFDKLVQGADSWRAVPARVLRGV